MEITEKSVEETWKKTLKHVLENGKDFLDRDGRVCREVLNLIIKIDAPNDVTKPIEILNSFKKWVYPPLEELESFMLGKKEIPGYYFNYGARAFNFDSVNQVDNFIIPLLKKDRTSRKASIIFYNPLKDSSIFRRGTPGMIMVNLNVRNEKLHATSVIRSNDLFFGWPANLYQISTLLSYIAEQINCKLGSITTFSISAHIFEDQFEDIKRVIGSSK